MPELSGPAWISRFPGSVSTSTLTNSFRTAVDSFLATMQHGGATITISATLRPPERAFLMHFSWLIAREAFDPQSVPSLAGVDIDWVHRSNGQIDLPASRTAAEQMVSGYNIVERPALSSRHTEGRVRNEPWFALTSVPRSPRERRGGPEGPWPISAIDLSKSLN